jgi:hypothetical protein
MSAAGFRNKVDKVRSTISALAARVSGRPITAAGDCEVQLACCSHELHGLLREPECTGPDAAVLLAGLRDHLRDLNDRTRSVAVLNETLLALHTGSVNGYTAAGRPAVCLPEKR